MTDIEKDIESLQISVSNIILTHNAEMRHHIVYEAAVNELLSLRWVRFYLWLYPLKMPEHKWTALKLLRRSTWERKPVLEHEADQYGGHRIVMSADEFDKRPEFTMDGESNEATA